MSDGYVIRWRDDDRWLREVIVDDDGDWTGARWADEANTAKPTRWTAADVAKARIFWPLGYGGKHPFRVNRVKK